MSSRLKSLELSGYKTFARRTVFEFANTVTSIVGPNGSGKSNIGDSLRWVLGEQSYRLLRGKKTEDMIFSGSESRSQAGMAYATITFDNTDGWLPIDFNEVAITRRAYRDGQNEYLINGQRVRLMDVSELLAQSGLAERTYTIIGQGLVDAALSLRADERRRLFEEAAGIGLHRTRREDALRRLEATQRNLERVQDILVELRPRLRSLERQVNRAEEYEETAIELSEVLREWYGYHWYNSQEILSHGHEISEEYENKLKELQHEEIDTENLIGDIRIKVRDLRDQLDKWKVEKEELRSQREVVSREIAVGNERKRLLQEQKRISTAELEKLKQRLSIQKELLISTQEEFILIEQNNKSIKKQFEELRVNYEQKQLQRGEIAQNIEDVEEEQIKFKSMRESHLAQNESRQKNIKLLEKELSQANEKLKEIDLNYQNTVESLGNLKVALKKRQLKSSQLQFDIEKIEEISREIEVKLHNRRKDSASLSNKHDQLLTKIQILEQSESNLEGYPEGARVLMNAAKDKKISGLAGVLYQILDVDEEYEIAIAAALGMYIEAVIINNKPDTALDILNENKAKGIILPVESIVTNKKEITWEEISGSGVIGIASELIKYPNYLNNVVEFLLGNVVIVSDRKIAKRITQNQETALIAVTLEGEAFNSNGPIISLGAKGANRVNTLLGKKVKLENLNNEISGIEKKLSNVNSELKSLENELSLKDADRKKIRSELVAEQESIREKKEKEGQLSALLERLDWQKNWLIDEIMRKEKDIEAGYLAINKSSEEIVKIEKSIGEVDHIYNVKKQELNNLDQELFNDQFPTAKTEYAVSARSLADSEKLLFDKRQLIDEIEKSFKDLTERIEDNNAELAILDQELNKTKESENEIQTQIDKIDFLILEEQGKLTKTENERQEISYRFENLRKQIRETEKLYTNAKVDFARQKEGVENLRRRIEDDLGLVSFEYADEISGPYPLPIDGFVEKLPVIKMISPDCEKTLQKLRSKIRRIGPINPEVHAEYEEVKSRHAFLIDQIEDLKKADADVRHVIKELDQLMEEEFCRTFENVAEEFEDIFSRLFGGGSAHLILSDPNDITTTGIEIDARLPGRRAQGLTLLSGGERSLTAVALIFALIRVSPTPFCLLDEVDAMLDEANTRRFRALLKEMSQKTQFVVVTHNRNTVEAADIIYGVTMGRDSSSQVLSLKIDELSKVID